MKMMYRLEYKEPYIVKTEMLKNRTHQSYRWKTIAMSEDLEALRKYKKNKDNNLLNYRIVNSELQIVG